MSEEPKVEPETKDEQKNDESFSEDDLKAIGEVKDRLKFFFSDANVRQDLFIRKLLMKDPNMVSVETLLKFNTIKNHTTKPAVVIKAAKELSDLLTINEKEVTIGRVIPFTEDMMNDNVPKSVYVKNLPLKEAEGDGPKQYDVTMDQVRKLFEKYGEIALIKLKWSSSPNGKGDDDLVGKKNRQKKKFPVGAALIEFLKKEDLEKSLRGNLDVQEWGKSRAKGKGFHWGRTNRARSDAAC